MYVLYNMPPLVKYDLRPAVLYWGPIFEKSYDEFTIDLMTIRFFENRAPDYNTGRGVIYRH